MKPFKWVSNIVPDKIYNKIRRIRLGIKLGYDYKRFSQPRSCCDSSFIEKYIENSQEFVTSMNELKTSMDKESLDIVDDNTETIIQFAKAFPAVNAIYPTYYCEKYKDVGNILNIDNMDYAKKLREQYNISKNLILEEYIFECGYGLEFLAKNIVNNLKETVFLDCGANWGDTALALREYSPKQIYAFEPVDDTFNALKKTVVDNKLDDIVKPIKKGVGESSCISRFYKEKDSNCDPTVCVLSSDKAALLDNQQYPKYKYELQEVEVIKIDDLVNEDKLNVGLIKMDIEGAETGAINGAIETIKKHTPVLLISIYHHYNDYINIKPLIDSLGLGYKFKIRKLRRDRRVFDTILIAYID